MVCLFEQIDLVDRFNVSASRLTNSGIATSFSLLVDFTCLWWVIDGNLNASGRVRDVNESSRLSASSVDGQRDVQRSLHQESVQHRAIVTIIVKSVDESFISDSLGGVGAPHHTLVKISNADAIVLVVELEHKSVHAFREMVD